MSYRMYKWKTNILTRYGDGVAIAVAESIEEARKIIADTYYKEEVMPNAVPGDEMVNYELESWEYEEYRKLVVALYTEPEIFHLPAVFYMYGSE